MEENIQSLFSPEAREFIKAHISEPTDKLLLQAARYPEINVPFCVDQISARRQIKEKLPTWYGNDQLLFPNRLSTEQCSSEITAFYKQNLVEGSSVCDLTGGLGIDTYFFSLKAEKVIYIERFKEYCQIAENNFRTLKAKNIEVLQGDARELCQVISADTFYIDPARRSECNKRLFSLSDCEPDVLQLKGALLAKTRRLIIKVSPMADITETLRLLPETSEIHIVAVKNECKEILAILKPVPQHPINIVTINFDSQGNCQTFSFSPIQEKEAPLILCKEIGTYLYEPNVAILKSGAFKLLSARYNVKKLHLHSHLYTSEEKIENFPGRTFEIKAIHEFSGKKLKILGEKIFQANITARNFPLTVEMLRKKSGIREGGDVYLFATTLSDARKIILECRKIR